ncbi:ATP-binding protein [Flavobacterium sp. FlaQc-47]|uniref:PAS domain-containing sensor histidine kinase n=1 Tax=Flavobacterium sp. FlaQc-47 TaxID=3374180 RepID=UPI0037584B81
MKNNQTPNLQLLKVIVDDAPLPIGIYEGNNLDIILANKYMISAYGKGEDVIGKSYMEVLPELKEQGIFEQFLNVLSTGEPFIAVDHKLDILIEGKLQTFYFNYNITPVYDNEGKIYAVMNTALDVTTLNLAHKQVNEAQEKLHLAVQSADLGIFEVNLLSDEVITSGRFEEIWGLEPLGIHTHEELIGRVYLLDKEAREHAYRNAQDTKHLNYEARVVHNDESLHWVRIKGTLVPDTNGQINTVLGIVQDITQQKQFAEKLKELVKKRTEELKRSNEDLLQFAHVVSHDLKEPVRKIKIFNELLKNELEPVLPEKGKHYIEKVQNASDRIFMMIDGILNYSAMNALGNPIESVNLNAIIESITTDLELVIEQKKANLSIEELPIIEGSPILIHQLFYNLINNSLKFSKEDVTPEIEIGGSKSGNEIVISVKDNGIGIDSKHTTEVFNAFKRLHPKEKYEGTGLGLSLCRKIVERHHGSIEIVGKSAQLDGTVIKVTLPLKQPIK